jgi:hypothetical protein
MFFGQTILLPFHACPCRFVFAILTLCGFYICRMFGIDKYDYLSSATFMDYTFESNGPKGKIQKVARFSIIDKKLYNFGFGD